MYIWAKESTARLYPADNCFSTCFQIGNTSKQSKSVCVKSHIQKKKFVVQRWQLDKLRIVCAHRDPYLYFDKSFDYVAETERIEQLSHIKI